MSDLPDWILAANKPADDSLPGTIWLQFDSFSDEMMAELSAVVRSGRLTALRKLDVSDTKVTDTGIIEFLLSCQNGNALELQYLDLSFTEIGNRALIHIASMQSDVLTTLKHLDLRFTRVSDLGLVEFSKSAIAGKLTALEYFDIGCTSDRGLKSYAMFARTGQLNDLQLLQLFPTQVSNTGLAYFARAVQSGGLNHLKHLGLSGLLHFNDALMMELAHAALACQMPNLYSIDLSGTKLSDRGLSELAKADANLLSLKWIDLATPTSASINRLSSHETQWYFRRDFARRG